jgi:hypothetical protein
MSGHTKGEWVVDESRHDGCINVLEPFRHVAMVSQYRAKPEDLDENEANARLIAAAPDLLSALQNLLDTFDKIMGKEGRGVLYDAAAQAIAKATIIQ